MSWCKLRGLMPVVLQRVLSAHDNAEQAAAVVEVIETMPGQLSDGFKQLLERMETAAEVD